MTPEVQALRDMWLAEMWPACPEVSREQRAVDRARAAQHVETLGTLRAVTNDNVGSSVRAHKTAPVGALTPDPGPRQLEGAD